MLWKKLRGNWDASFRSNVALSLLSGGLVIANIVLVVALVNSRARTVLVPPNLTNTAIIGSDDASENYYKAWGLYVAEMIGNVTPDNVDFVKHALGSIIDASIYASAQTQIVDFAHEENVQGLTSYYHADSIVWQPSTHTVFVSGTLAQTTADLMKTDKEPLTFQMNVDISAGQPKVTSLTSYSDPPHTLQWLQNQQEQGGGSDATQAAQPTDQSGNPIAPPPSDDTQQ